MILPGVGMNYGIAVYGYCTVNWERRKHMETEAMEEVKRIIIKNHFCVVIGPPVPKRYLPFHIWRLVDRGKSKKSGFRLGTT